MHGKYRPLFNFTLKKNAPFLLLLFFSSIKKSNYFIYSSTNIIQCQKGPGITSDFLTMSISINYPQGCVGDACRQTFDTKVQQHIEILYPEMNFAITFSNGETLGLQMSFCSFEPLSKGNHFIRRYNMRE